MLDKLKILSYYESAKDKRIHPERFILKERI